MDTIMVNSNNERVDKIQPFDFSEYKINVSQPSSFRSKDLTIISDNNKMTISANGSKVELTHDQLGFIVKMFVK